MVKTQWQAWVLVTVVLLSIFSMQFLFGQWL